jgi:GDP-4-dehydro-6-deoxy-D-mannose reductase
MRVLITGANGFVGRHLTRLCLAQGCEVFGTYRHRSDGHTPAQPESDVSYIEMELNDAGSVQRAVRESTPELLFHLAGWSFVRGSMTAPGETLTTNIIGQLNLFESLLELQLRTVRILVVGSCEEYGRVEQDELPVTELNPFRPTTPYGVSKVAQDLLAAQYHASENLDAVRVRSFHLTGPLSSDLYVVSSFARQIAEIEAGFREPVMKVGNLDVVRDFTDVRDAVRGYWLLLEKGVGGDAYNLGSGRPVSIKGIVDMLLGHARVPIDVQVDPGRLRTTDPPALICDATKLTEATGWKPEITLETTLHDTLEYWRQQIARGAVKP